MQQPISTADFKFACPRCAQQILVDDSRGGGWVECPTCQSTVVVPHPTERLSVNGFHESADFAKDDSDDGLLLELQQLRASLVGSGNDSGTLRGQAERAKEELQLAREEQGALRDHLAAALADRDTLAERLVAADEFRQVAARTAEELERVQREHEHVAAAGRELAEDLIRAEKRTQEIASAHEADLARLGNDLSALRNEKAELATLLEASEEFGRGASERVAELHELREKHAELVAEHDALLARQTDFEKEQERASLADAELARAEATIAELRHEVQQAREMRSELEAHVSLLQVQFDESVTHRKAGEVLQQQLRRAQEQLGSLEEQRSSLQTTVSDREQELREAREQQEAEIAARTERLSSEIETANSRIAELTSQHDSLRGELETARADQEREHAERETAVWNHEALQAQLDERTAAVAEAAKAADALREETKALQVRVEHLANQLQGRDRELDETQRKLASALADQAAFEQRLEEKDAIFQQAEDRFAKSKAEWERLQGEFETAVGDHAKSRTAAAQAQQRIESLERDLGMRRETLEEAQREVEKSWKEREEASRRLAALETENQANVAKLQEAAQAERTYRSIIEQTQAAHSAALHAMEPLRVEREQLKEQLEKLRQESRPLEQEVASVRAERDGLRTSVEHLEAQMEDNFEHLRVTEGERDSAKLELEAIRAGLERTKQHVAVLQSRRDQMREEIARLKQALGLGVEIPG